jgi:transposase-like protein
MSEKRKQWAGEEILTLLKRVLVGREELSKVCAETGACPSQVYRWQAQLFSEGAVVFQRKSVASQRERIEQLERVTELEGKLRRKDEVMAELLEEHVRSKKRAWGGLSGQWVEPDIRDALVDFVRAWSAKTEVNGRSIVRWLEIGPSKFYAWSRRHGRVNEHNAWSPRDHWLDEEEKQAIIRYWHAHPLEGYRRLTYMLLDADVVAAGASSVYRVLKAAGLLQRWARGPSRKGTRFEQPGGPHEHWHVDIAHLNLAGSFYYLCVVLDGYSRYIVHWELLPTMEEADVELIVQGGLEKFPGVKPRVI